MEMEERNLEILFEISQVAGLDLSLSELLNKIVDMAARLMKAQVCSILLLDEQKGELALAATQSPSPSYRYKANIRLERSISGQVVQSRQAKIIQDIRKEPGFAFPELAREGVVAMLCVPLLLAHKALGTLNCYSHEQAYEEKDARVLGLVANQAAMVIQNSRLEAANAAIQEHLQARKLVDKAKSLLMAQQGLGEPEAFRLIQKRSMDSRKPMREVAETIISTSQTKQ